MPALSGLVPALRALTQQSAEGPDFSWRNGLRFSDAVLEAAFWQQSLDRRRRTLLVSLSLIVIFMLATSGVIWLLSQGLAGAMGSIALVPPAGDASAATIVLLVIASLVATALEIRVLQGCSHREVAGFVGAVMVLIGVGYAVLLALHSPDDIQFFIYAFLHVLVLSSVFTVIPVRLLLFLSPALCAIFGAMLFTHAPQVRAPELSYHLQQIAGICALTIYTAYTMERGARQMFVFERQLRREHAQREQVQSKRLEWIGFIAQFLRHEFRNALLGVTSSLELFKRRAEPGADLAPIDDALDHAAGIRRSLDQAAAASALEAQLMTIEPQATDIQALLSDLAPAYEALSGQLRLKENPPGRMLALADPESLHQALSDLLEILAGIGERPPDIVAGLERSRDRLTIRMQCEHVAIASALVFAAQVKEEGVPSGPSGVRLFMIRRIIQVLNGQLVVTCSRATSSLKVSVSLLAV